eukprot:NODE_1107_length_1238_cov_698.325444.p1 GENE.NODE_1107_length_1238_cov_698.325444~~NODE_1107_length_1238_cov_698.325444.p1  ORF type:complete len:308 (-),score=80.38 NODE_1107_length_1238_cov_698.325444:176-1099(-)
MLTSHGEGMYKYDGPLDDVDALDHWVNARRMPLVSYIASYNLETVLRGGPRRTPPLFFLREKPIPRVEELLMDAASRLRGQVNLCFINKSTELQKHLVQFLRVSENVRSDPMLVLMQPHASSWSQHPVRTFRLDVEGLTAKIVEKFVEEYEANTLDPYVQSEPVPTEAEASVDPVGILVGMKFATTVKDPKYDVFVDFYAPWCGHSRRLEPTFRELARNLMHVRTLMVMKLDCTRNEAEGVEITGYPTLVLFPAGYPKIKRVIYGGSRTLDDMLQFLHRHVTTPFSDEAPPQQNSTSGSAFIQEEDL